MLKSDNPGCAQLCLPTSSDHQPALLMHKFLSVKIQLVCCIRITLLTLYFSGLASASGLSVDQGIVPHSVIAPHLQKQSEGKSSESSGGKNFLLTAIHFNHTAVLDGLGLLPFYERYLGMLVSFDDLRAVCHAIERYYHTHGYTNANCVIPRQVIRHGVVRFNLIEGVVKHVCLSGDSVSSDSVIYHYLQKIPLGTAPDEENLLTVSRLINELPGIEADISIEMIEASSDVEIIFDIQHDPFSFEAYINNRGTELAGKTQLGITAYNNSMLNMDEQIIIDLLTTSESEELRFFSAETLWPVGYDGSMLVLDSSFARSKPGGLLRIANIVADSANFNAGWQYLLGHNYNRYMTLTPGLNYSTSTVDSNVVKLSDDEIYSLRLEADLRYFDQATFTQLILRLTHGLNSLNSSEVTPNNSTLQPTDLGNFDYINFELFHNRALSNRWLLQFELDGQYTLDRLPVTEVIIFGGSSMGVAYDPAEFIGDHGLAAKVKLNYTLQHSNGQQSRFYAINDTVRVWGYRNGFRESGASFALGYRYERPYLHADVQYAKPLTRPVALENSDSARIFGEISFLY